MTFDQLWGLLKYHIRYQITVFANSLGHSLRVVVLESILWPQPDLSSSPDPTLDFGKLMGPPTIIFCFLTCKWELPWGFDKIIHIKCYARWLTHWKALSMICCLAEWHLQPIQLVPPKAPKDASWELLVRSYLYFLFGKLPNLSKLVILKEIFRANCMAAKRGWWRHLQHTLQSPETSSQIEFL